MSSPTQEENKVDEPSLSYQLSDIFGVSEDEIDAGAVEVHKKGVEAAIRSAMLFDWVATAEAYALSQNDTDLGVCTAVFEQREYDWLVYTYPGCMESDEFIRDYQRIKGQTFLAKPIGHFN